MALPDLSTLRINGDVQNRDTDYPSPPIPHDIKNTHDRYMEKLRSYAKNLPYSIEPYSKMLELLDFILLRITQSVEAKDYDLGFLQWDSMLTYWCLLKYPLPKDRRIAICKLYFNLSVTPGMSAQIVATCADAFKLLTKSKHKISIDDMRLPWKPIYDILSQDLFLTRREFEYTQLSWCMGYIAENSRQFFHPSAINEMLSTFLPQFDGTKLDTILSSQYYLVTFLPLSHPQYYLPMLFRIWESINSYMFDERMLQFISKLSEIHVDPDLSDPEKIAKLPDDEVSEGEDRPFWPQNTSEGLGGWHGLYKDVGIFTEHEWNFLMCKCLASMEIPLADGGSLTTGPSADTQVGFEISRLPEPQWRIPSLARIIVYSMSNDGIPVNPSDAPTPVFSPFPSALSTPQPSMTSLGDYLSAPISKKNHSKPKSYLAGSRALDSLARLIVSTESFFHPSNSGTWTADLSAFIKYIVYDFNKRWYEEQKPDCKTPMNRRLTHLMRRELVKSLRTVVLLAMFSQDSTTVSNIQSCLKSMSVMEPDLILHPVLERTVPSLETLVETQRTLAVIKALGAVAPAIVSRDVYYAGAKHLVPILQLLIPGIDLNDPAKTLCTTAFLVEISQYIKIGDLTTFDEPATSLDTEPTLPSGQPLSLPSLTLDESYIDDSDTLHRLSNDEEDALLKDSTGSFPNWITSFIHRVIQLLENLPEEGPNGSAGGASEVQVIDAVTGACSQICVHLSEPLYDLVLNMVFDYASTNVRTNAVRAIHQLVECVANTNPDKTLKKFFNFCSRNIRNELENGASSLRTTSSSTPLPSDATLHWNLAILRGTVYNDGRALLKYEDELLSLIKFLHLKTLSKRGYSWTGKLLSSLLLTLTHTYPLENKFVNPKEWASEEFQRNHHHHWGKLFSPEEITISWHVPNDKEIGFGLRILEELVEPTLSSLEELLEPDVVRDAIWRNDFCRHLTLVRNAFSGIPTFLREYMTKEEILHLSQTSDIIEEIPEMIASVPPINSGFALTDPSDPRYQYVLNVKNRFGKFLHSASVMLRAQGEENTVDSVQVLVRSIRTYMMEYGSGDSFYVNNDHYNTEKNVARQYAGQKVWPRAVYVRRARYYNVARLHWNSIERKRGPIADSLIDDLVEWSMWHYPVVRQSSQTYLEVICTSYDGVRRRALPVLFDALKPGTDDDRVKGALWTINSPSFGKYAVSEPSLAIDLASRLFECQYNEKPSIQDCVSTVFENCLNSFAEPNLIIYKIPSKGIDRAVLRLKSLLQFDATEDTLVTQRALDKCNVRIELFNESIKILTQKILEIGNSPQTHWRYAIYAIRCLRTLVRRDTSLTRSQIVYFLEKIHDDHPSIRYYAQRSVMKSLQNVKLRTFCSDPVDLVLARNHNPLKQTVKVIPSSQSTVNFLGMYKIPIDRPRDEGKTIFYDKNPPGWLVWDKAISLYTLPHAQKSTFQPWEAESGDSIQAVREITITSEYWESVSTYYSEENHETTITQDNVSYIKSIFQLLEDEPLEALKPTIEKLLADKDQDKQRAAAEFLAGVLGGSKHWPLNKQDALWAWFTPHLPTIFYQNIKTDTISIWSSFLEYMFYNKDPRRVQPLVDFLMEAFTKLDFNTELSFDAVKIISLFRVFSEVQGRRFMPWTDQIVERSWSEIHGDHDDVRAFISEILASSQNIQWRPKPSIPTAEVLVNECRSLPLDCDIMSMRGTYHKSRVDELVERFKDWRTERIPGVRAFQSKYDRVGVMICKWLYQSLHDLHAISTFDYILPLMPELFRFTEVNDNDNLASRAHGLLVRMCGVTPPVSLINPILDHIFDAIQNSSSWRVRLKALPLVQVFYFRQIPLINEIKIVEMLEVLCRCLDDEVVEVREMAAVTLSGILRLSPRRSVLTLKVRFVRLLNDSHIPSRHDPNYNKSIRKRHAAILGICALVDSYPYTVEKWMPDLLANVLAEHTYDPVPISTTVRKCAGNFKRTHQDTWHEDSKQFDETQLAALSTLLTGSSYYA